MFYNEVSTPPSSSQVVFGSSFWSSSQSCNFLLALMQQIGPIFPAWVALSNLFSHSDHVHFVAS